MRGHRKGVGNDGPWIKARVTPVLVIEMSRKSQDGQILFISVEQLSLNVADNSAKTLSVPGNMGGVIDDCRLGFVQMGR